MEGRRKMEVIEGEVIMEAIHSLFETPRPGEAAAQVEDLTSWRPARSQWPKLAAVTAGQNRG